MIYADVIVPLPLKGKFTYMIPPQYADKVTEGCRVIVQFGKRKCYTAIVYSIYKAEEPIKGVKEIITLLDEHPVVLPQQLQFWEWIASYYICKLGEVYKAAIPSALKLESETFVYLNPKFEDFEKLSEIDRRILNTLMNKNPLSVSDIDRKTKLNNIIYHIKLLADKKAIYLSEDVQKKYSEKTEIAIKLSSNISAHNSNYIYNSLSRAKKQQELLSFFLEKEKSKCQNDDFYLTKKCLTDNFSFSSSVIDGLIEKNILTSFHIPISRLEDSMTDVKSINQLNNYQEKAYADILNSFGKKSIVLLHGVTSSGKTEIYIKLINDYIREGKQVLYLLPEIALTSQITDRLKKVFGNKLLVYHSKFNDNERAETWQSLLKNNEYQIVLGARSSVFLPFTKLGLVIVDEEHESSYKQQDPAPRYNAKNAAIILASLYKSNVLLGSATPSIESFYNASTGRYGLVSLNKRHQEIELPTIIPINTRELRRKKQMKSILSPPLIDAIDRTLANNEQVILFQNRRGFSPLLECTTCSWTPKCLHCDVSLTYHKAQRILSCHYCAAVYSVPTQCPDCNTPTLDSLGYGTERIEEIVNETFPEANTSRMDLDTTRSKRAFEHIIADFEQNKTNVLIGTQMVSKGLDFENVNIVGILNADNMLNYPDFRAHEKAFQLMTQVSGRAGRRHKRGTVYLQTAHPEHPIISFIKNNDYLAFYDLQIDERRLFKYPPFFRLIEIVIRAKEEKLAEEASRDMATSLRQSFNDRVLGPTKPPISRVQSLYIRKIILKIENQASPQKIREFIEIHQNMVFQNNNYKSVLLHYDVDPM